MTDTVDKVIIESEVKFADQSDAALKGLEGTLKDIVVVSDSLRLDDGLTGPTQPAVSINRPAAPHEAA
jgi:hypothetical protein